jgi:hypothetical protein
MYFLVAISAIIVGSSLDPVMWVGPIVGAIASRKSWVAAALGIAGALVSIVIDRALRVAPPADDLQAAIVIGKLVAGVLFGFFASGVGLMIRRRKKTPMPPTS